ncbi:hypothetical protein BBJ28_00020278 [Nothophytophthora sp. Chile5]|nr:hypothetical protein BBJ28_00020278 [Nothophytophthora sp. Chile5]
MLEKMGVRLSADSPLRWRSLVAAIRQELDDEPMDAVFLFDWLVQLFFKMPGGLQKALFGSPLFLHRFAVAFEGLDAELFKLESDELCHAEGIYELCLLIRDNMESNEPTSELSTFLATFAKIFEQDEPKVTCIHDMTHVMLFGGLMLCLYDRNDRIAGTPSTICFA